MNKDFQEFMESDPAKPGQIAQQELLDQIRSDLYPNFRITFLKLIGVHSFVGGLTLLFCPQFGFGLSEGAGLSAIFMKWGETWCTLACAATFSSISLLVSSLILRPEEVRTISSSKFLQITLLSLLSVGFFLCVRADVVFDLGIVWTLGSIFSGIISLESGWIFRRWIHYKIQPQVSQP